MGIVFTLVTRVASDPFGVRHLALIDADGTGQRWLTPLPIVGTHPEHRIPLRVEGGELERFAIGSAGVQRFECGLEALEVPAGRHEVSIAPR